MEHNTEKNSRSMPSGRLQVWGSRAAKISGQLGMTTHSLYTWKMKYGPNVAEYEEKTPTEQEVRRLRKELKRVTGERDLRIKTCTLQNVSREGCRIESDRPAGSLWWLSGLGGQGRALPFSR